MGRKGWACHAHLLEVVGLEEFAVIQQISQMGHKPPVAKGDAVGSDTKARRNVRVRSHGPHEWDMSRNPTCALLKKDERVLPLWLRLILHLKIRRSWFNFQSGHMPRLSAPSPVGGVYEAANQ